MIVRATVFFDLVGLAEEWTERAFFERINKYMNTRNREPAHKHVIQNPPRTANTGWSVVLTFSAPFMLRTTQKPRAPIPIVKPTLPSGKAGLL